MAVGLFQRIYRADVYGYYNLSVPQYGKGRAENERCSGGHKEIQREKEKGTELQDGKTFGFGNKDR